MPKMVKCIVLTREERIYSVNEESDDLALATWADNWPGEESNVHLEAAAVYDVGLVGDPEIATEEDWSRVCGGPMASISYDAMQEMVVYVAADSDGMQFYGLMQPDVADEIVDDPFAAFYGNDDRVDTYDTWDAVTQAASEAGGRIVDVRACTAY